MALIRLRDVCLAFGPEALLDNAGLVINHGDKIAVVGRNGQGKSTLLKILSHDLQADSGDVIFNDGVTVSRLQQEVPNIEDERTVYEVAASGFDEQTARALQEVYTDGTTAIDTNVDIWTASAQIQSVVSQLQLQPDEPVKKLSGGQKRRAMLARALVTEPSVLLMDEPTNHLDVDSVVWLETFLQKLKVTLIFVTHDRQLIKSVANRIVEIDRGTLTAWDQTYEKYLQSREQALAAQETQDKLFDKKLKQEEDWIRQGIKARRTRNEGRVRALKKLREERAQRRDKIGQVALVRNFSTTIMRGDKVAIIGPNGSGKTTLLKIILGDLVPDEGSVEQGTNLEIAYFDQLRQQLDETKSAADNVSDGSDFIEINGGRKHIMGYMQEFLFSPERARAPITALSGVDTLELLEYTVLNFPGTVLMVSHDREFIDNIATSTIALQGHGKIVEQVGGYSDYLVHYPPITEAPKKKPAKNVSPNTPKEKATEKNKLTYGEQKELRNLPAKIEKLEAKKTELEAKLADPAVYQGDGNQLTSLQADYTKLDKEVTDAYSRWDELESKSG